MEILPLMTEISNILWSLPVLFLFFGVCVFMTLQLNFVQLRYLPESIRAVFKAQGSSSSAVLED